MEWYLKVLKNYANFSGRARRKEYWTFTLVNMIVATVLNALTRAVPSIAIVFAGIYALYFLAIFIPGLAVTVRRLHDTGRSGLYILVGFIPLFGALILLLFMVQDSQPGSNQYGPNPKNEEEPV